MGVVYRAHDTGLGRMVAIKLLGERSLDDEDARARLLHEARTASRLNHAHICTIHEVGESDGLTYIVMECVEGRRLNDLTRPAGLPAETVVRYGAQIAEALAHAHEHGVLHRDLKTANLMITAEGRAKILDFGLAMRISRPAPDDATHTLESITEMGTVAGTPHYLAPEILQGRPPDESGDLWALGVVLYEMACGEMPFRGATQLEVFAAILTKPPVPLPSVVPSNLRVIVERCLMKEPTERYQKARNVQADLEGLTVARRASRAAPRRAARIRIRSLAVLPLADLSQDYQPAYFADGMTEALITDLAKIRSLKVISRTSVMRYKGSDKSLPQIAGELGVDGIVEGSVLRAGGQVRITAQLIHAASDTHIWAESYDRDLKNVLSLQSEVAQAIANAVQAKITPEEKRRLSARPAVNPAAHELYLKGRHFWNQRGTGLKKAADFFQRALNEEPNYAPAYAGLADAFALLGFYGFTPPRDVMPKAKEAARKALALDPDLAEAHASLGYVHIMFDWDFDQAEKEFQQAFKLNPTYGPARYWHSILLFVPGRWEEAIAEVKLGLEYDPLSVYMQAHLGVTLCYAGRWAEAVQECSKALEWDPNFLSARCALGASYYFLSGVDEAIRELQGAVEGSGRDHWALAYLGAVYAASGNREQAEAIVRELEDRRKTQYISALHIATVYTQLGKLDEAFQWLEEAYQERSAFLFAVHRYTFIGTGSNLRHDPRFQDLMSRIGLTYDE
jgi:serine/threonine protein kinase/Flp pilus assembly protein TadD